MIPCSAEWPIPGDLAVEHLALWRKTVCWDLHCWKIPPILLLLADQCSKVPWIDLLSNPSKLKFDLKSKPRIQCPSSWSLQTLQVGTYLGNKCSQCSLKVRLQFNQKGIQSPKRLQLGLFQRNGAPFMFIHTFGHAIGSWQSRRSDMAEWWPSRAVWCGDDGAACYLFGRPHWTAEKWFATFVSRGSVETVNCFFFSCSDVPRASSQQLKSSWLKQLMTWTCLSCCSVTCPQPLCGFVCPLLWLKPEAAQPLSLSLF